MTWRIQAELLLWLLSLIGAACAVVLVPALFLGFGIALPLGWLGAPESSFHALRAGVGDVIPLRLLLAAGHGLVFWYVAHELRFVVSRPGPRAAALLGGGAYLAAALATLWTLRVFWRL